MLSAQSIKTYVSLCVIAGVTAWLAEYVTPKPEKMPSADISQIDYYSTNIRRMVMDTDGKPKEVLFAEGLQHFKNDDHTEMQKPVMTLYNGEGESPWIIHSDTSKALSGNRTIWMNGNVLITRETEKNGLIRIITSNVKFKPRRDYAETQEFAQILSDHDETIGNGVQIHFKPQLNVTILANVWRKHEMH